MIRKYFISNISIMLLVNLLVKPFWIFVIDRNVQLHVGHEEYGLYYALVGLTGIFSILLDLGITNYNNKSLAENNQLISIKLPNMSVAKAMLSAVYFAVVLLFSFIFQYGSRAIYLVFLLAIVQTISSFLLYLRSNVSAHHHFKTDSLLSVLDKILMIMICSFLLFSPIFKSDFKIEWFIYAQISAYLIAVLIALYIIITRYSKITFSHFSMTEVKAVCKKSMPYAVLILLMG
ncbi:MAG: oligosaccharide flippase family protein, partial [Chitinophagaceae bacterium]|nr:oligosaccharide flippase family protein [Chitinophagaceae bacterium]